jgi:hypothetical protein
MVTDRRWAGCGALVLVWVLAAACTGNPVPPEPAPHSSAASVARSDFGTRNTTLTCADSVGASPADSTAVTDRDVAVGLGSGVSPLRVPSAADAGLRLPPGMNWYFRKDPIPVRAGARDVTISVSGPGQVLVWVPSDVWTSGLDAGPWASSSVTLQSCPDHNALFLGGVLAATPDTCVMMRVQSAVPGDETVRRRLDGTACSS